MWFELRSPKLETNSEDGDETKLRQKSETVADDVAAKYPNRIRPRLRPRLGNGHLPKLPLIQGRGPGGGQSNGAITVHIIILYVRVTTV